MAVNAPFAPLMRNPVIWLDPVTFTTYTGNSHRHRPPGVPELGL